MSIGKALFLVAAVLLFVAGIGVTIVPNSMIWALFCIALGLVLDGFDFRFKRR
jgi:hypothetical protein